MKIAWTLTPDGRLLSIFEVDPRTRRLEHILYLRRLKPMTDEEALKYVTNNFPNDGAVRAAADSLGLTGGSR